MATVAVTEFGNCNRQCGQSFTRNGSP